MQTTAMNKSLYFSTIINFPDVIQRNAHGYYPHSHEKRICEFFECAILSTMAWKVNISVAMSKGIKTNPWGYIAHVHASQQKTVSLLVHGTPDIKKEKRISKFFDLMPGNLRNRWRDSRVFKCLQEPFEPSYLE